FFIYGFKPTESRRTIEVNKPCISKEKIKSCRFSQTVFSQYTVGYSFFPAVGSSQDKRFGNEYGFYLLIAQGFNHPGWVRKRIGVKFQIPHGSHYFLTKPVQVQNNSIYRDVFVLKCFDGFERFFL